MLKLRKKKRRKKKKLKLRLRLLRYLEIKQLLLLNHHHPRKRKLKNHLMNQQLPKRMMLILWLEFQSLLPLHDRLFAKISVFDKKARTMVGNIHDYELLHTILWCKFDLDLPIYLSLK